jgi:hypothetical protein
LSACLAQGSTKSRFSMSQRRVDLHTTRDHSVLWVPASEVVLTRLCPGVTSFIWWALGDPPCPPKKTCFWLMAKDSGYHKSSFCYIQQPANDHFITNY